jgi:hypothetical protein
VAQPPRKRLGEILLEAGVIDGTMLQAALGHQRRWGGRVGQALIDLKMATEEQVVAALAAKLGFERIALDLVEYGPGLELALRLVPHEFAERNQLLPYSADANQLLIAMADPTNMGVIDELAFRTGRRVKMAIAGDREIARAIRRLYLADKQGVEAISIDERDEGPVEMLGSLEQGYPQGLDDYFRKEPRDPADAGAVPAAKVDPAPPARTLTPPPLAAGVPPPLPLRPLPTSGPEARLAEAVRRIRLEDDGSSPAPPTTPAPELIVEVVPDGEGEFGPRIEAMLDGLDRIGLHEGCPPEVVRLSRLASAMMRLMIRKGLVTEDEMVAEFVRTEGAGPRRS